MRQRQRQRRRFGRRRARAWLALAAAASLGAADAAREPAADAGERFDTVVVDAGHGGSDTGAKGPTGTLEKDLALGVARELALRLRARGLRVVMTRDADVRVPLEQRTAIANDARGDLFVSIHANAAADPHVHGTETYFLALDASDAAAAGVAQRENRSFEVADAAPIDALSDPFIALLGDLISTEHLDESAAFARGVQRQLATLPLRSRGVKQAMFVVLSGVQMPAALVEMGFVTHVGDERKLLAADGRKGVAAALERAILAYGRRHDARRGGSRAASEAP